MSFVAATAEPDATTADTIAAIRAVFIASPLGPPGLLLLALADHEVDLGVLSERRSRLGALGDDLSPGLLREDALDPADRALRRAEDRLRSRDLPADDRRDDALWWHPVRADAVDLTGAFVREPDVAIGAGGDPVRALELPGVDEVLAYDPGSRDLGDVAARALGEPEVAVRAGDDAIVPLSEVGARRELGQHARCGQSPDHVGTGL